MKILFNKIIYLIVLFIGIVIINFTLFFMSPGDPTNQYFSPKVKKANLEKLKQKMGVDLPWHKQLKNWSLHILKGDLGYSWSKHRPVKDILKEAIPATLQLTILALIINLIIGSLIGIFAGINSNKLSGKFLDIFTLTIYSTPVFLLALFLIYVFSEKLQLLPPSGMNTLGIRASGFWVTFIDRLRHIILPVSVLGLIGAATTSRYVQEHIKLVMKQDYIRTAFAKGLSLKRIYFNHAFKNALLPVATLIGIYFPFLLGSALIVEVIFAWPGMGRITFEAISSKDYPVLMAVNMIAAIMVISGNLISDILYRYIDPRIRIQ